MSATVKATELTFGIALAPVAARATAKRTRLRWEVGIGRVGPAVWPKRENGFLASPVRDSVPDVDMAWRRPDGA